MGTFNICTYPGGRTILGVGLRPLACWTCRFESHLSWYLSWVLCVVR